MYVDANDKNLSNFQDSSGMEVFYTDINQQAVSRLTVGHSANDSRLYIHNAR